MRTIARRLARLVVVVVLVTLFTAFLISLVPGDPVHAIAPFSSPEQHEALRQDLGLDDPLPIRYVDWLSDMTRGDLGKFYGVSSSRDVRETVATALPITFLLILYAQMIALVIAVPLAVLAAYRSGSWLDRLASTGSFGAMAIPNFALGLVLAYVVGVRLRWLPPTGYTAFGDNPVEHLRSMLLPALTLAVGQVAVYFRLLRSDLIATLQEDFVLFAKAQGFSPRRVLWRHALRPSSLTLLTVVGVNMGALIGGAVTMEVIFSLPGMGLLIFRSIQERQYVALQSVVAIVAVLYVLVNFVVDLLHQWLDPRIRHVADA